MQTVDGTGLAALMAANSVVVVDFSAAWCGPCKKMQPILDELATECQVPVAKVEVDEQPELTETYGVSSVPTILVVAGGSVHARHVGMVSKETIMHAITGAKAR